MNTAIAQTLNELIYKRYEVELSPELTIPEPHFGDVSTNVAMRLAGQLQRKPQDIAKELADDLESDRHVASVSVAGPGFLNITLTDDVLVESLSSPLNIATAHKGSVVVIETNNPNPFKDLHIGHAYNCIVADTLANLLDVGGAHVHRVSYHGDIGLHVGKSMWAILQWCDGDISKLESVKEAERSTFMSERYIEGSTAYDHDENAKSDIESLARESFAPSGDYKTVYDTCKAWSFDYITTTVARLGSKNVERRYLESEADGAGVATVRAHIGEVFSESDGAVVFAGEAFGLHTRVFIASRGTGLYEARDLGLMQLKQQEFHPAKSYIITGGEQREYFKVVIKAAELALPELNGVTTNVSTGTVKLSSGKMSSRTGNVLNIEWLFAQLHDALGEHATNEFAPETIIGALRYAMLKVRIGGDVVFDIDASLSIEGNSGPYLQYAHARACSILKKSEKSPQYSGEPFDEAERMLVRKLAEYPQVVQLAASELLPHMICTYLYELAQQFNRFYEQSRVIGDEREEVRLWLVQQYQQTLEHGLGVLGIPAPEQL